MGSAHALTLIDEASRDCPEEAARNDAVNPPVTGAGEPASDVRTEGSLDVGVDHVVPTQLESRSTTVSPTKTDTVRLESWSVNTKVSGPIVVGGVGGDVVTVVVGTARAVVGTDCVGPVAGVDVGVEDPCRAWDGPVGDVGGPVAPIRPSELPVPSTEVPEQVGEQALPRGSPEREVPPGPGGAEAPGG